jgi:hypothetical protein
MKTRLIFLVMLIVCISCGTNNKPVSDAQKEKIIGEVKEVVNTMFKGCEEANFDMAITPFLDSPDFAYQAGGRIFTYREFADTAKFYFGKLLSQKRTLVDEKYVVIDNSNVAYESDSKWEVNYKDGHSTLKDPWSWQVIFKKIDNKWRVINLVEFGLEKIVKYSNAPKELNQVELFKKFLGSWKCDWAKDTTAFYEGKPYGTGLDCYFKFITKGKVVMEGRQLRGYDTNNDKFIISTMLKGTDINVDAAWFMSKNKFQFIPYNYIANPDASFRNIEGEFKSPDMIFKTTYINKKPVRTETWTRVNE